MTRRAQTATAVAALAATLTAVAALAAAGDHHDAGGLQVAWAGLGMAFGIAGAIARDRHPANHVGSLLIAVGFGFAIGNLELSDFDLLYSVGLALDVAWIGLLIHTIAVYPTGAFDSSLARGFAAAGWVTTTVLQVIVSLVSGRLASGCVECPENLFAITDSPELASAFTLIQGAVFGSLTVALGVALLVVRWRRSTILARRAILPPVAASSAAVALLVLAVLVEDAGRRVSLVADIAAGIAVFAIPAALLIGMLRMRFDQGRLANLAIRLRDTVTHEELRASLVEALGDPSLRISYWSDELDRYVDQEGRPSEPVEATGRSLASIERAGRPVARLDHDAALDAAGSLVDAAAATAALALENERLRAELRAQIAALRRSRARIVAAEDAERRRLERNLHDGAQQRLLAVGISLQLARSAAEGETDSETAGLLAEADGELRAAIDELRDLAHGLHPAVLAESGLGAAVRSAAERCPIPVAVTTELPDALAAPVEAVAYYVVSEALTNVAKHSGACSANVELTLSGGALVLSVTDDGVGGADPRGSGLTGLADRVGAIGGRLAIDSPVGRGTALEVIVPCGS